MAFNQFPEIIKNALASIPLRRREYNLSARPKRRAQRHNRGKHMKHRQRTHLHIFFSKQQPRTQPRIVNNTRIAVLGDLWHARRAASVKIGGNAVALTVGK